MNAERALSSTVAQMAVVAGADASKASLRVFDETLAKKILACVSDARTKVECWRVSRQWRR